MTIDEAIQIEKYFGKKDKKALEELQKEFPMIYGIMDNNLHENIVEWLEELKFRRVLRLQCEKEFFAGYEKGKTEGYAKAIDKFAERLKERLKGMQMVELQGEDVCPCRETGEDCPYMNQDVGCQYCAREQTIKDIDEIAEQMKRCN